MGYLCRTCKKSEMQSVINRLCIELSDYSNSLALLEGELKLRDLEEANNKLRKEVSIKLLNKLYDYVDKNKHIFSDEEVHTIASLIDSGYIKNSKQLREYGIV